MSQERIFIGVAWPYANGPLHLGHIAGVYLAADIFARYHRMKGNEVLMVSGSDQHGTPITLRAEQEGKSPQEVVSLYHQQFLDGWKKLGISFDLFTTTGTENHRRVVHDLFLRLLEKGYIYKGTTQLLFCPRCQRFLPDRYVEGECPFCHTPGARGDQCDRCGKPLNSTDLINPQCRRCGTTPRVRDSEHFFLRLSAFQEKLLSWVRGQRHWRPNALNFTLSYVEGGLQDRAVTRDIEWGVPLPLPGYESKRIYVWFEAVIGYLSASKEWAQLQGDGEKWRGFWEEEARAYYFLGKDNIPFHTIIWPAMLMGYGGLNLPYDVPANEFLTLEGKQFSTSRNWAIWLPDYLERYEPDPLRYYLSINMPEAGDADFTWQEFFRRNNDELLATFGNLAHRVLTFTFKHFEGGVPQPGELDEASRALLAGAEKALREVEENLERCRFREGMKAAMALAQQANRYVDSKAPWKTISTSREECATSLWTALSAISCLRVALYPFLPFSCQKLHTMLGLKGKVEEEGWKWSPLRAGTRLPPPQHLFHKLEERAAQEEVERFQRARGA